MSKLVTFADRRWIVIVSATYVCVAAVAIGVITVFSWRSLLAATVVGVVAVLMPIRAALWSQRVRGRKKAFSIEFGITCFIVVAFVFAFVTIETMAM